MPSASAMSVPRSAARSSSAYQSALLRASRLAVLTGLPQIGVDDRDALGRPAQSPSVLDQRVLVALALLMLLDLLGTRLADVHVGAQIAMAWRDLVSIGQHHGPPPAE